MTDNTEYLSVSRMRKNRPRLVHDHPRNRLKRGRDSLSLDEKIKRDSRESRKLGRGRGKKKKKKKKIVIDPQENFQLFLQFPFRIETPLLFRAFER